MYSIKSHQYLEQFRCHVTLEYEVSHEKNILLAKDFCFSIYIGYKCVRRNEKKELVQLGNIFPGTTYILKTLEGIFIMSFSKTSQQTLQVVKSTLGMQYLQVAKEFSYIVL